MQKAIAVVLTAHIALLVLATTSAVLQAQAIPAPKEPLTEKAKLVQKLQKLAERYDAFIVKLNLMKMRLDKGSDQDQEVAKLLEKVAALAEDKGVNAQYVKLLTFVKSDKFKGFKGAQEAYEKNESVEKELKSLLVILRQDESLEALKARRLCLEKLINQLKPGPHMGAAFTEQVKKALQKQLDKTIRKEGDVVFSTMVTNCQEMLAAQTAIRAQTKYILEEVQKNKGRLETLQKKMSLDMANQARESIGLATKILDLPSAEIMAAEFFMPLTQVRQDLKAAVKQFDHAKLQGEEGEATLALQMKIEQQLEKLVPKIKQAHAQNRKKGIGLLLTDATNASDFSSLIAEFESVVSDQQKLTREFGDYMFSHIPGHPSIDGWQ